jgi:hypothetical protein
MRNLEFARRDDKVSEEENVNVDGTRAFRQCALSAHAQFDGLNASEQEPREEIGFYFDNYVQKPGLIAQVLGLGFIDRRPAEDVNIRRFETIQGIQQVRLAIAEVGAKGEKSLLQGVLQKSEF